MAKHFKFSGCSMADLRVVTPFLLKQKKKIKRNLHVKLHKKSSVACIGLNMVPTWTMDS